MASSAVTDRALRYRAQRNAPEGAAVCCYCGSETNIDIDHIDGHEEHGEKENLAWACRSCNTAKANTMRKANMGRKTHQYNPRSFWLVESRRTGYHDGGKFETRQEAEKHARKLNAKTPGAREDYRAIRYDVNPKAKGATTLGEWMQAVGAITPHKGRKYAGYNYGLVSDMPVPEAVAIIRATSPAKRSQFAAELHKHGRRGRSSGDMPDWAKNPDDPNESLQDKSRREWRENYQRVAAKPEAASEKDLRRAIGYLDHTLTWLQHRAWESGKELDSNVLAGYKNEVDYYKGLIRKHEMRRGANPRSGENPSESAAFKAGQKWYRGQLKTSKQVINSGPAADKYLEKMGYGGMLHLSPTLGERVRERQATARQMRDDFITGVSDAHQARYEAQHSNPVGKELKSTGRAALKQYDRITGTTSSAVGSILDLPRKWAGSLVGERNPRPANVPRNYEAVSIRSTSQDASDVKQALEGAGIPAIIVTQKYTSTGSRIGSPFSIWTPRKTYKRAVKLAEKAYFGRHPELLRQNPSGKGVYDSIDIKRQGRQQGDEFFRQTGVQPRQLEDAAIRSRFDLWWEYGGSELSEVSKSQAFPFWRIGFAGSKRNPGKFERCVRDVKARGGDVNAYAVCTAAGTRNPAIPTFDELQQAVIDSGHTPGVSYEDAQLIYASSQETIPGTMGHPAFEAIYHKETGWLTVGDTHTFVPNPNRKTRFERCVESVTAGGSADDPRAVCAAAGRAKYGQSEMTRRAIAGKRRHNPGNPANPHDGAVAMYESFHGKEPEGELEVQEEFHQHEHLAPLGLLVNFKVATLTGLVATIASSSEETNYDETAADEQSIFLASNEAGTQLYFVGGDQSVDLDRLKFPADLIKDDMIIGVLVEITYRTRKKFDKFKLTDYYHELGEDTAEQPLLRYDPLSPHLYVTGGAYKIKMPLIGMSPGIEN